MSLSRDVIIAGCGPAGSTAATLLAERGFRVEVFEREHFPRFQIGESLLPYNARVFERLGVTGALESGGYVRKYGAQFTTADGERSTKFSFDKYLPPELQQAWQVRRDAFDALLMNRARDTGAMVNEGWTVSDVSERSEGARIIATNRESGESRELEGKFFIDASGPSVLSRTLGVKRTVDPNLRKVAVFGHYRNALLPGEGREAGNIVIAVLRDAWCWMIPIGGGLTSLGLVVDTEKLKQGGRRPAELLQRAIDRSPVLRRRFENAAIEGPVRVRKDFSFSVDRIVGDRFALTGDAAGFIDPIFSTGVLLAMQSGERVADAVADFLLEGSRKALRTYATEMRRAMERYRRIIRRFYSREFMEVFLDPQETLGLEEVVIRLLAGNAFEKESRRWKMELFYGLVYLQRRTGSIAPPVPWDTLPGVFDTPGLEENSGRPAVETSAERAPDRATELRGYGS